MGKKAKKLMKKQIHKGSLQLSASNKKTEVPDFLPLEGGPGRPVPVEEIPESSGTVLYIGRIPHGFYEEEMKGYFKQFGTIKRLRIARNRKTGNSKNYGFIQYEDSQVAKIVADTMHNYLLFEHVLQVHVIPAERVHPKLWKGANHVYKPPNWVELERKRHDKDRSTEEQKILVKGILKRDKRRRKRIKEAGIDYECPKMVGEIPTAPKKIRFDE